MTAILPMAKGETHLAQQWLYHVLPLASMTEQPRGKRWIQTEGLVAGRSVHLPSRDVEKGKRFRHLAKGFKVVNFTWDIVWQHQNHVVVKTSKTSHVSVRDNDGVRSLMANLSLSRYAIASTTRGCNEQNTSNSANLMLHHGHNS